MDRYPLNVIMETPESKHAEFIRALRENADLHRGFAMRYEAQGQTCSAELHAAAAMKSAKEADDFESLGWLETTMRIGREAAAKSSREYLGRPLPATPEGSN